MILTGGAEEIWGNVGLALEIARTSGRHMRDVCDYYKRYQSTWLGSRINRDRYKTGINMLQAFL